MYRSVFWKALAIVALGALAVDGAHAFNFGNMMNPSKWWGGDRDRDRYDDDYYGAPPYGYGYPAPGYGAPAYTAPAYTAPGYATPGYPAPGYGYAVPGYAAPPAAPAAPAPASTVAKPATQAPAAADEEAEIARLKERIRELETARSTATSGAEHPYDREYRFPDSIPGAAVQAGATPHAAPEYPVYSPFGPPADFPPLPADDEFAAPSQVETVAAPSQVETIAVPTAPAGEHEQQAVPDEGPVSFTPGNPATYVPPMQDISGTRVYEFGH